MSLPLAWTVVMPVKRLPVAKSRLLVDADLRQELALAMAVDTASAALGAESVRRLIVVTDDADARDALLGLGAKVVSDAPDAGLNSALSHGISIATLSDTTAAVATLSSDLPALRPTELDELLAQVDWHAVVADRAGSGTTLLAHRNGQQLHPSYGKDSLQAHISGGAKDLSDSATASLRCDVDTVDDLKAAVSLGIGAVTAAVLGLNDASDGPNLRPADQIW